MKTKIVTIRHYAPDKDITDQGVFSGWIWVGIPTNLIESGQTDFNIPEEARIYSMKIWEEEIEVPEDEFISNSVLHNLAHLKQGEIFFKEAYFGKKNTSVEKAVVDHDFSLGVAEYPTPKDIEPAWGWKTQCFMCGESNESGHYSCPEGCDPEKKKEWEKRNEG